MNEKIVYTYVVADLLHTGHLLYLENAKNLAGDGKLIVGVLTDEAVMEKKPRPIMPFDERLRIINSLKCVDCAVAQCKYSPIDNILQIRPNILVESSSHKSEDIKDTVDAANSVGARVIVMPYYPEQSSTKIKKAINENRNVGENGTNF